MQIAMICRTSKVIHERGFVDVSTDKSRYRGLVWVYEELPDSGK